MPKKKRRAVKRTKKSSPDLVLRIFLGFIVFLAIFAVTFVICATYNFAGESKIVIDNKSLVSTYVGVTPCADCEGIKTELSLYTNPNTYTETLTYLGKNTDFTETGTWTITQGKNNPQTVVYKLTSNGKNSTTTYYEVINDEQIRQLDGDGNAIPSDLPFTLTKR